VAVAAHVCHALAMPRSRPRRPPPDSPASVIPPSRAIPTRPTPEQIAKVSAAKRPSPPGQPTKAVITLRLALERAALERLIAQSLRREGNIEALIEEILERAVQP
jgi:hypothetical protein